MRATVDSCPTVWLGMVGQATILSGRGRATEHRSMDIVIGLPGSRSWPHHTLAVLVWNKVYFWSQSPLSGRGR